MKTLEGDLIETAPGLIFDVKGLIHPPNRAIAFPRYFPSKKAERKRNGTRYDKIYSLSERYELLRKKFPQYLIYDHIFDETLCEVPILDIKKTHRPAKKLNELRDATKLDALEIKALQMAELLKKAANVSWESIGISGSILVGLHKADSDIDPIIYGSQNCKKTHLALEKTLALASVSEYGGFRPYARDDLKVLFDFRSKDSWADFESFVRTESRKVMQGKFLGTDYFVRFVKNWKEIDETYGDTQYTNMGDAQIRATIADDGEAIFTPCVYKIGNTEILEGPRVENIEEITSFRGRFCEQARNGEVVLARGKLEHVHQNRRGNEYFRLLLGNKPSDFMILA